MADELITIGNFQFLPEAEAARMRLEAEGIPVFLADAETVNMDWLLGNAIGSIKLQVPAARAEVAHAALESMRAQQRQHELNSLDTAEAPLCLACGAELPITQSACAVCGWSYAAEEGEAIPDDQAQGESEEDSERGQTQSIMETLRSLKRPLFLLMLTPALLAVGLLALLLLACLVRFLVP